jgi:hypothetical protein
MIFAFAGAAMLAVRTGRAREIPRFPQSVRILIGNVYVEPPPPVRVLRYRSTGRSDTVPAMRSAVDRRSCGIPDRESCPCDGRYRNRRSRSNR